MKDAQILRYLLLDKISTKVKSSQNTNSITNNVTKSDICVVKD